jgi:hypothetical protein
MFWAGATFLSFEDLPWTMDRFYLPWQQTVMAQITPSTTSTSPGRPPRNLKFENWRDRTLARVSHSHWCTLETRSANFIRIFSLVSMCREGRGIPVDYGVTDQEVAYGVLKGLGTLRCVCIPLLIARCMNLEEDHRPGSVEAVETGPFIKLLMQGLTFHGRYTHSGSDYVLPCGSRLKSWNGLKTFDDFALRVRYYQIRSLYHRRSSDRCRPCLPLLARLHNMKHIMEIDAATYTSQSSVSLTEGLPADVATQLLKTQHVWVQHAKTANGNTVLSLVKVFSLERIGFEEYPTIPSLIRIALWALKEIAPSRGSAYCPHLALKEGEQSEYHEDLDLDAEYGRWDMNTTTTLPDPEPNTVPSHPR